MNGGWRRLAGRPVVIFSGLAVGVRIVFWATTGRVWEDALITVGHARNLVEGLGLVHHPGEPPVHGFTSAVFVLIPLAGELVDAEAGGIVALRVASLVAVVIALVYADRIGRRIGLSLAARCLVLGYLALDQNQVFYGMAGMETQVVVAILLASVWYVLEADPPRAGLTLGLALLARPDLVLWAIPAVSSLAASSRRTALVASGVAAVVVLPWIAATTVYYGSPIPHTILAKSAVLVTQPAGILDWLPWSLDQTVLHFVPMARTFAPFLEDSLVVTPPAPIPDVVLWVVAGAMFGLLVVGLRRTWRIPGWAPVVVLVIASAAYGLLLLPSQYYDWYQPPFTAAAVLLVASGIDGLPVRPRAQAALVAILLVAFAVHLPFSIGLERRIQAEIETGVREPTARYLQSAVRPGEAVVAESAGYLGFDSRVTLFDYPGLTSEVSLKAIRELPHERRTLTALIERLRPAWLVLRPAEQTALRAAFPDLAATYVECARFSAPGVGDRIDWGGYTKWTIDSSYLVLRAKACPNATGPAP